jgi:hypothetical protein
MSDIAERVVAQLRFSPREIPSSALRMSPQQENEVENASPFRTCGTLLQFRVHVDERANGELQCPQTRTV